MATSELARNVDAPLKARFWPHSASLWSAQAGPKQSLPVELDDACDGQEAKQGKQQGDAAGRNCAPSIEPNLVISIVPKYNSARCHRVDSKR
jgi:hypothetical protein